METITIYHNEEIKTFNELFERMGSATPCCYDPPDNRCECEKCFEYEIQMEKIREKQPSKINAKEKDETS